MTAFTDRADAVEAAIQDVARDIEADLGKLTRYRGRDEASGSSVSSGPAFRDPGASVATLEAQKTQHPGRVEHTLSTYRAVIGRARETAAALPATNAGERSRRLELVELAGTLTTLTTHDEAVALVASFEEA